jgi:C-terminal processing protease CtpA/Prc
VPSVSAVPRQDYESLEAFTNILSIVKKNYVEDVDTKNLVSGAINGMLSSLDPHSAYLTPELYKELQMDTQGRFGGLGIEITVKGGISPSSRRSKIRLPLKRASSLEIRSSRSRMSLPKT